MFSFVCYLGWVELVRVKSYVYCIKRYETTTFFLCRNYVLSYRMHANHVSLYPVYTRAIFQLFRAHLLFAFHRKKCTRGYEVTWRGWGECKRREKEEIRD